jgi:hypothetical protein
LNLRDLIFATAGATEGVGELVETLKWGQPAYLPKTPRTGTTVRIDALKGRDGAYAIFFHCQTSLIETFREVYPDSLSFQGNRAIELSVDGAVPEDALRHCISLALTYHRKRPSM